MSEVKKPVKLDDITVKKIEEALVMDCSISEVCLYANITRQTYYNWINSFPELKERFDTLRANPILKARTTVYNNLDDKELALKYLERKNKKEFSPRTEVTGADGKDLMPDKETKEEADKAINSYLNDNTGDFKIG